MQIPRILQSITTLVNNYKAKLISLNDEEFMLTPPIGGWSYSEVYSHIFDSSLLSLLATQKCINGEGETAKTHFSAKAILFFGMLPPGKRYKVPKRLINRVKKINIAVGQQFIDDFEFQLGKIMSQTDQVNSSIKIAHPRLGYLNTKQWLRFIEIHLNHHLKQLRRIEKSFM